MLRTARLDNADLKVKREPIDLMQLIRNSIEAHTVESGVHSIEMQSTVGRSTVWADPQLLRMALFQLFDNAVKYSTPGSASRCRYSGGAGRDTDKCSERGLLYSS